MCYSRQWFYHLYHQKQIQISIFLYNTLEMCEVSKLRSLRNTLLDSIDTHFVVWQICQI